MRRRNFIALVAGIAALPLAAHAQQAVPSIAQAASTDTSKCAQNSVAFPQRLDGPRWNGWGADLGNSRFQPAAMAGLTRDQVPSLRLKWAFGFPGRSTAIAQPTIVGGLLFVGGGDREVYALDAKSGCTRWAFKTEAVVRTAISFAPIAGTDQFAMFFGDVRANAYAVNAITGALIWKTKVDDHPAALITGAPTLYSGILYVPVSSIEEVTGISPTYQCCTFRGSVVALIVATGKQIWKGYTIPEAPHPTKRNAIGTQLYGPSGAAVWSAPTIDVQRQALYVATGNNYSDPPSDTSDAILAFDLATGRMLWHRQATAKDSYIVVLLRHRQDQLSGKQRPRPRLWPIAYPGELAQRTTCAGHRAEIRRRPRAGSRPGGQNPVADAGRQGWSAGRDHVGLRRGSGPCLCRELGRAVFRDGTKRLDPNAGGGLFALDLATGKISMQVPPVPCGDRSQCSPALSAAMTAHSRCRFLGRGERTICALMRLTTHGCFGRSTRRATTPR